MKLEQVIHDMTQTEQTKGQNVFQHGISVHNYFKDLYDHVINGRKLKYEWKLPEWVFDKHMWKQVKQFENLLYYYHVYHDCGKPYCRTVDDEGRVHFPNHAAVSAKVWNEIDWGDELDDHDRRIIRRFIEEDMDIHLLKAAGVDDFYDSAVSPFTQLITGLCEIHSNAKMFGGIDSTSFKIKWKALNKTGKRILKKDLDIRREVSYYG